MWRYAKKAGFRTVYIDGQRHHGHLHNLMTPEELATSTNFNPARHRAEAVPARTSASAQILGRSAEDGEAARFVFINKMGSHFPMKGVSAGSGRLSADDELHYSGNEVDPQNLARPSDEQRHAAALQELVT